MNFRDRAAKIRSGDFARRSVKKHAFATTQRYPRPGIAKVAEQSDLENRAPSR
jgi:hypothetical protein